MIEVFRAPSESEKILFIAKMENVGGNAGRVKLRIFQNPERLHLARIDSYVRGCEIGTVLLLAASIFGQSLGLSLMDGGFEPDYRRGRTSGDLEKWYNERMLSRSNDGHSLMGNLLLINDACNRILRVKKIEYRINLDEALS